MPSPLSSRSPSPLSPTQPAPTNPPSDSLRQQTIETFNLLQDLYLFSLERSSSALLEKYDLVVLNAVSSQLSAVMAETTRNCLQIAQAMISLNIQLESRLQRCQLLSTQELLSIKSTLRDFSESGSSQAASSSEELRSLLQKKTPLTFSHETGKEAPQTFSPEKRKAPESTPQSSLPLKKRKYFEEESSHPSPIEELSAPELSSKETSSAQKTEDAPSSSRTCSVIVHTSSLVKEQPSLQEEIPLDSMLAFVDMIAAHKGWGLSDFSCHRHEGASCPTCRPIRHLMTPLKSEKELFLRRQIFSLLKYTDRVSLASCLYSNPMLSEAIKQAHYLRNYQLALIIKACNIGAEINSPRLPSPATQASIYLSIHSVINGGADSTFVQNIKEIWLQTRHSGYPESLQVMENSIRYSVTLENFAKSIPDVQRSYPSIDKRRGTPIFADKPMTHSFAKFLARVTFGTIDVILKNSKYHHLLTSSPSGEKVVSMNLVMRICALILCSSPKYKVRILPCKVSVKTRDYLHFDEENTKELFQALLQFAMTNNINLNGSELPS
ncbi:hypothetical protein [Chlamydiifrater phoenicopteri]|uniref:hypothetical protein n=1 Tax=Chlamydiifrater phoenicopteri TaxID=2681469 RepID=UPI001BCBDCB0|nr:hypothetical protein [Chlamydiifrater phoenicopteri]